MTSESPIGSTPTTERDQEQRGIGRAVIPMVALLLAVVIAAVVIRDGAGGDAGVGRAAMDGLVIADARMPMPIDPARASVYFTMTNTGDVDDALVGARASASSSVTLHRTDIEGSGRATMSPVGALTVPAGAEVALQPGGDHLMLDVPPGLTIGDTYPITVQMERGGDIEVEVRVVTPADAATAVVPR